MKELKRIFYIIVLIFTIVSKGNSVDPSIYWGDWKTKGDIINIEINITENESIRIKLDKKFLENVKYEFIYGKNTTVPFLHIHSLEENVKHGYLYFEHHLYLIIGSKGKCEYPEEYNIIRGFYQYSKTINDHYGTMENTCCPIELIKVNY